MNDSVAARLKILEERDINTSRSVEHLAKSMDKQNTMLHDLNLTMREQIALHNGYKDITSKTIDFMTKEIMGIKVMAKENAESIKVMAKENAESIKVLEKDMNRAKGAANFGKWMWGLVGTVFGFGLTIFGLLKGMP